MSHSLTVRALVLTLLLGALAACGNKGPLYLPDEPMPAQANPETPAGEDGESDENERDEDA